MKKAYVLSDHLGDNGFVREGMILKDVTDSRFKQLEKKKLVREATADDLSGKTAREMRAAAAPSNKMAPDAINKRASELDARDKALGEREDAVKKAEEEADARDKALAEREAAVKKAEDEAAAAKAGK